MEGESSSSNSSSSKAYRRRVRFLGEIPNATLGNSQDEEPGTSQILFQLEGTSTQERMSFASRNITYFNKSSQCAELGRDTALFDSLTIQRNRCDQKAASSNYHETSIEDLNQDTANLPDEHSLASALEDVGCKDGISDLPPTCSSDEHPCTSCTNEAPQSSRKINALDKGKFLKVNGDVLRNQTPVSLLGDYREQSQSFPVNSRIMPVNPEIYNVQVLRGVSSKESEFVPSVFRPQCYPDHHMLAYVPYQSMIQSNMAWHDVEENTHTRLQEVYACLQLLQNQGSEQNQVLNGPTAAVAHPQYIEMPNPHQIGEGSQDSSWSNTVVNVGYDRLDASLMNTYPQRSYCQGLCGKDEGHVIRYGEKPTYPFSLTRSSGQFSQSLMLDQVGNQTPDDRILTLSHEFNSPRTTKSAFVATSRSPCHVEMKGNVYPSDDPDLALTLSKLHIDGQNSWCSSTDYSESKQFMGLRRMKFSSEDVVGPKIHILAKDQKGCCYLQRVLTEGTAEDIEVVFIGVIDHFVGLMTDPIGNYLVQKLIEVCTEDQRTHIVYEITRTPGELISLSCDKHGTRPVQRIIETIRRPEQICLLVSALSLDVYSLMKDVNGSHVSQLCLKHLLPEHSGFLLDSATAHCFDLAKDRQGCCVLQKCISHSSNEKKHQLISALTTRALILSEDRYGNYVIQYILGQEIPWATAKILNQLDGHYGILSLQKYSSNVVEKCLCLAGDARRVKILQELLHDPSLLQILLGEYGNYVIQSALKISKGPLYDAFVDAIKPHVPVLRNSPYGRRVLSCARLKNKLS
ncbi:uncharacterized protein [Typha angustifolia]|uniref:uncharacterized protein n=1 Tax=Typha angustifolia TaxID=59011 RepID=UPI003C2E44BC